MAIDLFTPVVPDDRLNLSFQSLAHRGHAPARHMLAEVAATFTDKDGNFVKDFQTTAFDARLWELYLHVYLRSDGFVLDETRAVPDYIATKTGRTVFIEATSVNPSQAAAADALEAQAGNLTAWDLFAHRMENVYPIKFGSPLFTKMKKRYWEQEHVKGQPFMLAIQDFQSPGSMVWTASALERYLYGFDYSWFHEVTGELNVRAEAIGSHRDGKKQIPSGFFSQPDTEHVSAVLFSNSGTFAKFNRMGFQAGCRPEKLLLVRAGACFNHDPNATEPHKFRYVVGSPSAPVETWSEGLSMYHNPKALVPVPEELFPGIAHHRLDDQNRIRSAVPPFHPLGSLTLIVGDLDDPTPGPPVAPEVLQMLAGRPPTGGDAEAEPPTAPAGVRRISRAEFMAHKRAKGPILAPLMEKAWFANEKGLIGTVFLDVSDDDWNYAILGPDTDGIYRWVGGGACKETQQEAEQALISDMSAM